VWGKKMVKLFKWLNQNKTYAYTIGISIFAFMFMLNSLFTIQLKIENADLNEQIFELDNRLKSAKQENQKLQTDIYIEQEATERLSMVKSSEMPIKVIEYKEKEKNVEENKEKEKSDKMYIYLTEWYAGLQNAIKK
jgi:cell division protein FtsB